MLHLMQRGLLMPAILVLAGHGLAAFNFFDPENMESVPKTLSEMGIFADMAAKTPTAEAVYYDVNTALWTDAAHKERFIVLKPGTRIGYKDTIDVYDYPDQAVFVKHFLLDTIPGDAATRIYWETRILYNKKKDGKDYWHPFTYSWRMNQADADLVSLADGATRELTVYEKGQAKQKKWAYPSKTACERCHYNESYSDYVPRGIAGFFTAQLNRDYSPTPGVNQLKVFFDKGVFKPQALPNFATLPKWAPLDDESASLDLRARAYIGANCSYCHGSRGLENGMVFGGTPLNYDFHTNKPAMTMENWELSHDFNGKGSKLIVPGHPEKSVLLMRIAARNQAPADYDPVGLQMPPLGSYYPDTQAVNLITRWIAQMPVSAGKYLARKTGVGDIQVRDGLVYLPEGWTQETNPVSVYDLRGRPVKLLRVNRGIFRMVEQVKPGIYLIRVGEKVFRKNIL